MITNNSWNQPFLAPPSFNALFNNDAPIELEIGMGRSHFLFDRANAVPDHNIIGIEWKGEWVHQANRRALRENVNNLLAIWGNAWQIVPHLFADGSLSQIVLNFPDPWWKKKHHKRKIINDLFVNILVSKLKVTGRIYLATDVPHLFEEYVELLLENSKLKNLAENKMGLTTNPQNARSHREKKCEALGLPIYRAWFEKM